MREYLKIAKALGDGNRGRMLLALGAGELCVCQINALFALAPSTISKHLSILHQAGLVDSRKEERWVYYRLAGKDAPASVRAGIAWVQGALGDSAEAVGDRRKLKQVMKVRPSILCRRQAGSRS